jgi:hypothetical protein
VWKWCDFRCFFNGNWWWWIMVIPMVFFGVQIGGEAVWKKDGKLGRIVLWLNSRIIYLGIT